ncbi:MAG: nucleotidyltransferase domain-containing protein [Chloroflexota bacterium]
MHDQRKDPLEAAQAFVDARFPDASVALVGGSVVRGEATPTSDLDIVIVHAHPVRPYRETFRAHGWPVEVFVHTVKSWRFYVAQDVARRTPSMPAMTAEGVVLRDRDGLAATIKGEARAILEAGPPSLSDEETENRRYGLTDVLDDFVGADRFDEGMIVAGMMAQSATDLMLAHRGRWTGHGKWMLRSLHRADPESAGRLSAALESYARDWSKALMTAWTQRALDMVGGPLFEGYHSMGRDE